MEKNFLSKEVIAFVKKNAIVVDNKEVFEHLPIRLAHLLGKCGYSLDPSLKGKISKEQEDTLVQKLTPYLKEIYGFDTVWESVYTDPKTVLEKTELELRIDQIWIYLDPSHIDDTVDSDLQKFWNTNGYKITEKIVGITSDDFAGISEDIISSKLVLSDVDQQIFDWFLSDEGKDYLSLPENIYNKETLCKILSKEAALPGTVTDVLRTAIYMSTGLVNLIDHAKRKFKISLSNSERRIVLRLLEGFLKNHNMLFALMDTKKNHNMWVILSQVLHTDEKKNPLSYEFFQKVKSKDSSYWNNTFESNIRKELDKAKTSGSYKEVLKLYKQRPGEFIRHFDDLFRRSYGCKDITTVLEIFNTLKELKFTPKHILGLLYYYDCRIDGSLRSYLNNMGVRVTYTPRTQWTKYDDQTIELIRSSFKDTLSSIYAERGKLNKKVVLNLIGEDYLSLSTRQNTGFGTESVLPGHKIYFEKKGLLRFFTQWIDDFEGEDLDAHAVAINSETLETTEIGWNSLFKSKDGILSHSGDVRYRQGNCAEYITVDVSKDNIGGYNKILFFVNNYEGRNLNTLDNYIGYSKVTEELFNSETEDPNWVPAESNTEFRSKVNVNAKQMIGFVIDLKEGYIKVLTEGFNGSLVFNSSDAKRLIFKYFTDYSMTLKDIIELYVKARGGEYVSVEEFENAKKSENFNPEDYIVFDDNSIRDYTKLCDILL